MKATLWKERHDYEGLGGTKHGQRFERVADVRQQLPAFMDVHVMMTIA